MGNSYHKGHIRWRKVVPIFVVNTVGHESCVYKYLAWEKATKKPCVAVCCSWPRFDLAKSVGLTATNRLARVQVTGDKDRWFDKFVRQLKCQSAPAIYGNNNAKVWAWLRQFAFYQRSSQLLWTALAAFVQRRRQRVYPAGMRDPGQKCCCQPLLDEFQCAKFSLEHDEPADFCRSQWQCSERSLIWLIYRWLLAAFFAGGVIGSLVSSFNEGTWFIYLTDWGFTLCFYACAYGAVVATIYYIKPSYFESGSWALKFYWCSHFTTTVLAMMITLVFWTALYPTMSDGPIGLYNLWAHALNSVCMLFDCFMVAFPTHLMHFIYPLVVGLLYGAFSLVYFWAGGTDFFGNRYIYFILDWEQPGLAIGSVCGCIVLALVFCVLVFWIYRFRIWMHERCGKSETQEIMQTQAAVATQTVQTV